MIQEKFIITENKPLNAKIMLMRLSGNAPDIRAGQFINIKIDFRMRL